MRMETVLRAQAVRYPEKMALVCGDERITYRDLDQRIVRVASGLKEKGLGAGDRVVLFLNNGVEIVELFYAAFALGAIVVPVTTRLTTHELLHICSDSQPSVIAFEGSGIPSRRFWKPIPARCGLYSERRQRTALAMTACESPPLCRCLSCR